MDEPAPYLPQRQWMKKPQTDSIMDKTPALPTSTSVDEKTPKLTTLWMSLQHPTTTASLARKPQTDYIMDEPPSTHTIISA